MIKVNMKLNNNERRTDSLIEGRRRNKNVKEIIIMKAKAKGGVGRSE